MEQVNRQVNIKTISGEVKSLTVLSTLSVTEFKEKVFQAFGVPVDKQRLICQGKLLKDEQNLADHVREDGQTVHLMVRADGPPQSGPQVSGPPPPQPAVPFQFDQMINAMVGNFLPGAQVFGAGGAEGININFGQMFGPPQGAQNPPGNPPSQSNPPNPLSQANPPNVPNQPPPNANPSAPRAHVEIALPFDRLQNIGSIVNELHGPGASFPPPRMPQLPFVRNPMTLLGGYLHNYEFQLLRFLPFVSRVSDLLQRESLITDPNERALLQNLAQRVSAGLNELTAATAPVANLLAQLQVGQAPGTFQLRIGNMNVAPEVRPVPQPVPISGLGSGPNVQNAPQGVNPLQGGPIIQNAPLGVNPFQGMQGGPQGAVNPFQMLAGLSNMPQGGAPNVFSAIMPMFSQMLGANQAMTLRELINTLQIHDEEESLPMMDFFYNLNIGEVMGLASGNWDAIEQQRRPVRESLLKLMEGDSPEGRSHIVQILINYIQRQYAIPPQFASQILNNFDSSSMIQRVGEFWFSKLVNHVMDYEGTQFVPEFKKILLLMIGNYTFEMKQNVQGGMQTVLMIVQTQMQTAMSRVIPPELSGMVDGLLGGIVNGYLASSLAMFEEWQAANRTEEEAKEQESPAGTLLASWIETIERDMRVQVTPQAPLSHSYLSSDIFTNVVPGPPGVAQVFLGTLQGSGNEAGLNLSLDNPPGPVVEEFLRNLTSGVRQRLQSDTDYRQGRFEYLDRIHK